MTCAKCFGKGFITELVPVGEMEFQRMQWECDECKPKEQNRDGDGFREDEEIMIAYLDGVK